MKTFVYDEELIAQFSPSELEEARRLTKKKMNQNKLLALLFFCCAGIGLFLPFGKRAQLYKMGYAQLHGRTAFLTGGWPMLGFFMSWLMATIAEKWNPNVNTARIALPERFQK